MRQTPISIKTQGQVRRHLRIRKKILGTSLRPRLVVHRSHLHLYAQLIDDTKGQTLVACSTRSPEFKAHSAKGGNVEAAKHLGELLGRRAKERGIEKVVFDRGGYRFHGRVKALAEAARAAHLDF